MERLFAVIFMWCGIAATHREHKVHNIVLYPDKHSWCNITAIKQVVGHPGCESVHVENNVCVGTCFSYSIPRTEPTAPGQVAPYCDSCKPSQVTWKQVTLKCNGAENKGSNSLSKRVEIIEECTCSSCNKGDPGLEGGSGDHQESHQHHHALDFPQFISLVHQAKAGSFQPPRQHDIAHERLGLLLKVLGGDEDQTGDTAGLEEALNHNTLEDIAHKVEEMGHIKVDVDKLRELLSNLEPPRRHHHGGGPHHSKVLDDEIYPNPTLDMAPHHLKPAIAGSEITYHTHLSEVDDN